MITTPRLLLRRARETDLEAFHTIMSDPRAMRYWSCLPHTDIEQTRAWLAKMLDAPSDKSDDYVIEKDGVAIGKAGAWRLPEIGFLLLPSEWRKGYAFEALSAFVAHARGRKYGHLTADVDPRNDASLAVLAKLGFQETGRASGTFTVGEELVDSIYLRLDL